MQLVRRFRLNAVFCALAVLVCELVSRPIADMGICDDGPYILMAQKLAATGHVVYNGWSAAMIGWQLYVAAAFIKLFGYSLTTVRMSTLLVAMALAFLLQRILVRANINERNATIGTLALVLSPLYLMLSVTFMTDIQGLFAILLCLYGCLRALQAATSRAAIGWLCFAVVTNAICGTSRQIAWLGILVMVPSTLWLLRAQRRVLIAGGLAVIAGALFIFGCIHWLKQQPYVIAVPLLAKPTFSLAHILGLVTDSFLDFPFLLLPIVALFLPQVFNRSRRSIAFMAGVSTAYLLLTIVTRHLQFLEPTYGDWVNVFGMIRESGVQGTPSVLLHRNARVFLTLASLGGLLGVIVSLLRLHPSRSKAAPANKISWRHLGVLLAPFTIAYVLMLLPLTVTLGVSDRYFLGLLVVALICMVRYYQDRIRPNLPVTSVLLIAVMAVYGIASTHNTFSLYRARVSLAAELRAAGVPDTSVDHGWEYNLAVEIGHSGYVNESRITLPADAYVSPPPLPPQTCPMALYDQTPHIHPVYGVSFDANACYGAAPFAPVTYSRWLGSKPGTLYVVRYTP